MDLYRGKKAVLTPLPENAEADVERVATAWRACGAIVHRLRPQEHDKVFAAVSHLPHLLAFALVDDLPHLPAERDAATTAEWIAAVLRGDVPVPPSIAEQVFRMRVRHQAQGRAGKRLHDFHQGMRGIAHAQHAAMLS